MDSELPAAAMTPLLDLTFPHGWQAEIQLQRPPILPPRRFTYPRDAEEVERGALEVMVRPAAVHVSRDLRPGVCRSERAQRRLELSQSR